MNLQGSDEMAYSLRSTDDLDLTMDQIRSIISLVNSTWPSRDKTVDDLADDHVRRIKRLSDRERRSNRFRRHVLWDDDAAIANAITFSRTIHAAGGSLEVMALAAVCVRPDMRGNGFGRDVVIRSFQRIDKGEFSVCLYQTGVPDFYRKYGADTVESAFCNSRNADDPDANPWWEPHIMVYPGSFPWPDGKIDLNGRGY